MHAETYRPNKDERHSSLEKYTSHIIERVLCERRLETEQRLQHIDHPTLLAITAFLSRSPGLASFLQLIWTSSRRGYIIIWHPSTSCERHNSHSIQPLDSQGHPLISSTGCNCYLHRCIYSFDNLAESEVNMQQFYSGGQNTYQDACVTVTKFLLGIPFLECFICEVINIALRSW